MRPYWKGYLKLALVSCPIALHAACSSAERIAFRQINTATGNRLRQQLIDEETREPVASHQDRGGYSRSGRDAVLAAARGGQQLPRPEQLNVARTEGPGLANVSGTELTDGWV